MRDYEGMFILDAGLEEEPLKKVVKNIETSITEKGGKVLASVSQGKKRLSYPIRKKNDGIYQLIDFQVEPANISDLKRGWGLTDAIYRVLLTVKSG